VGEVPPDAQREDRAPGQATQRLSGNTPMRVDSLLPVALTIDRPKPAGPLVAPRARTACSSQMGGDFAHISRFSGRPSDRDGATTAALREVDRGGDG
jgi:hypothetical protein